MGRNHFSQEATIGNFHCLAICLVQLPKRVICFHVDYLIFFFFFCGKQEIVREGAELSLGPRVIGKSHVTKKKQKK